MRTLWTHLLVAIVGIAAGYFYHSYSTQNKPIEKLVLDANNTETIAASSTIVSSLKKHLNYIIRPKDVLHISVKDEKDLDLKVLVHSDGNVHFPLLGNVQVSGLTAEAVQNEIRNRLLRKRYVLNAEVAVVLVE